LAKKGEIAFDIGKFFEKGLHMGSGQADVKRYNRYLCNLIHAGRAKPSWIVSHEISLDEAPNAYEHFDCRDNGWTKVILHPGERRKSPLQRKNHKKSHALAHTH
jgi:threonine dehydrogenase-like Zn-dependent dehydrogenase